MISDFFDWFNIKKRLFTDKTAGYPQHTPESSSRDNLEFVIISVPSKVARSNNSDHNLAVNRQLKPHGTAQTGPKHRHVSNR